MKISYTKLNLLKQIIALINTSNYIANFLTTHLKSNALVVNNLLRLRPPNPVLRPLAGVGGARAWQLEPGPSTAPAFPSSKAGQREVT